MIYHNRQRGFSQLLLIVIIAVIAVGGYIASQFTVSRPADEEMAENKEIGPIMTKTPTVSPVSGDEAGTAGGHRYSGVVLAGSSALLLDFNKSDYDAVFQTDKLIVLYFYANWCPLCKAEFPLMQEAFNELTTDKVIGFRVNYNDDQTDSDEEALARQYGVAYQHTKVFVRNGERIGKWPDSWNKDRYLSEINSRL